MPTVICPACHEKGRIPLSFVGVKIKCRMCGSSFLVKPPGSEPIPASAVAAAAAVSPNDTMLGDLNLPQAGDPQTDDVPTVRIDPAEWIAARQREREKGAAEAKVGHDYDPVPPKRSEPAAAAKPAPAPKPAPASPPAAEPSSRALRAEDAATTFGELPSDSIAVVKEYKVLALREMWLEGRFNQTRLEEIINDYAKDGWIVKSLIAPQFKAFSGVSCEELVVLLER
jgi:hypothetical protein